MGHHLVWPFLRIKGKSLFVFLYLWVSLYSQLPIKVIQRLRVSDAAISRHFQGLFTKLSSFCASLRPCCVCSFRRPRCFLISFRSCRAANSASSACFCFALFLLFRSPTTTLCAACKAITALYNPSNRLASARSGSDVLLLRVSKHWKRILS